MTAATLHTKFSEAEIKRLAEHSSVLNVRDPRTPSLMLRFRADRARASWIIVLHMGGKTTNRKLASWPDVSVKAALELLPKKIAELTADPASAIATAGWDRTADLLRWFADRVHRDRGLSAEWRATVRSVVSCQLLPRIGSLRLIEITRDVLDERLVWPMQEIRSLAYTRQTFAILKLAFRKAVKLKKLTTNPLADVVFSDFTDTPIKPKPCALRPNQLPGILERLSGERGLKTSLLMLPLMMLCHGTRISETRLAKWQNITFGADGEWFIPAADAKTKADHRLPLTSSTQALLRAYRTLQKQTGYTGAYLFPRGDGDPLTKTQAQDKIATIANGEWCSHDLRKIARSMWADLGVDYLIGELLLNHALDDLDTAYIHTHAMTLKRDALERWHLWLQSQGLIFFATDTGPIPAAASTGSQTSNHAA